MLLWFARVFLKKKSSSSFPVGCHLPLLCVSGFLPPCASLPGSSSYVGYSLANARGTRIRFFLFVLCVVFASVVLRSPSSRHRHARWSSSSGVSLSIRLPREVHFCSFSSTFYISHVVLTRIYIHDHSKRTPKSLCLNEWTKAVKPLLLGITRRERERERELSTRRAESTCRRLCREMFSFFIATRTVFSQNCVFPLFFQTSSFRVLIKP